MTPVGLLGLFRMMALVLGVYVGHEAVFRRGGDDDDLGVGVADVIVVLEEVGGDDDDLVPRVAEHAEDDVQAAGGADGHYDVVFVVIGAEAAVQGISHGLADGGEAGVGGVAVYSHGVVVRDDVNDGVFHRVGGSKIGVAYGKVKYVFGAELIGETLAFFEHRANGAAAGGQLYHSFTNQCLFLLVQKLRPLCERPYLIRILAHFSRFYNIDKGYMIK